MRKKQNGLLKYDSFDRIRGYYADLVTTANFRYKGKNCLVSRSLYKVLRRLDYLDDVDFNIIVSTKKYFPNTFVLLNV